MDDTWSNSDFPYECLVDVKRTQALKAALHATVQKGAIVVDVGAGSGILSFFAAAAGASKVYSVETDRYLASVLVDSIRANNLSDVIEVVHGDARCVSLPRDVDVLVCEVIETGLMDEGQVPVINALHETEVIGANTKIVPSRYETFLQLGYADFTYYGYKILMPQHHWPYLEKPGTDWLPRQFRPLSKAANIASVDFAEPIHGHIDVNMTVTANEPGLVNAVKLSSLAHLTEHLTLGATNAFSGDKILPLEERQVSMGQKLRFRVTCQMGGGLASLHIDGPAESA